MHSFEDEQELLARKGAEPLAGSGFEDESDDGEFAWTAEEDAEVREQ